MSDHPKLYSKILEDLIGADPRETQPPKQARLATAMIYLEQDAEELTGAIDVPRETLQAGKSMEKKPKVGEPFGEPTGEPNREPPPKSPPSFPEE